MHEIIAMCKTNLLVFEFHPNHFFNQLVAPLLHDFERSIELTVKYPEEDEALVTQDVKRNPLDFTIGHRVVLERKLAVGKHKLRIVLLGAFDPPWRVDQDNLKFANFLNKEVPVEVSYIAIYKSVTNGFLQGLLGFIKNLECLQVLSAMNTQVLIDKGKFEGVELLRVVAFVIIIIFLFLPFFGVISLNFIFGAKMLQVSVEGVLCCSLPLINIVRLLIMILVILFANLFSLDLVFHFNFIA